jgi:amidase
MQYIDAHPELAEQGIEIRNAVDVSCSQKKVAYVRQDPSACAAAPAPRMTADELTARRNYRLQYKANAKTWLDSAGADHLGVDAVVYPGLLSDISLNDGGGGKASFGRRDTPGAGPGIPTVVFPAGYNDHGEPINLQLLGRAWDDDELVGMAYAFEQQADKEGNGHQAPATAPALQVVGETAGTVGGSVPATLSLTLGAAASFGAFTPGVAKDYTASTTANVISTAGDAALSVSDPGHLMNGAFALPSPLEVSLSQASWTAPVSNDPVTIAFEQHVGASDALRTGTYSKTLTFTLATTMP